MYQALLAASTDGNIFSEQKTMWSTFGLGNRSTRKYLENSLPNSP